MSDILVKRNESLVSDIDSESESRVESHCITDTWYVTMVKFTCLATALATTASWDHFLLAHTLTPDRHTSAIGIL